MGGGGEEEEVAGNRERLNREVAGEERRVVDQEMGRRGIRWRRERTPFRRDWIEIEEIEGIRGGRKKGVKGGERGKGRGIEEAPP